MKEEDVKFFTQVCELLTFTLASKVDGYSDVQALRADFQADSRLNADDVAIHFGHVNFEQFITSFLLEDVVEVQVSSDGKIFTYFPKRILGDKRFNDMRGVQDKTLAFLTSKEERSEREKLSRALRPQFAAKVVEGRKRLMEIVHQLGGQSHPVHWQEVQNEYLKKHGTFLAGDELRKYFGRDKAFRILSTLCVDDFELHEVEKQSGMMFVSLRKPYEELLKALDIAVENRRQLKLSEYKPTPILPAMDVVTLKKREVLNASNGGGAKFGGSSLGQNAAIAQLHDKSKLTEANPQQPIKSSGQSTSNGFAVRDKFHLSDDDWVAVDECGKDKSEATATSVACWEASKVPAFSEVSNKDRKDKYTSRNAGKTYTDTEYSYSDSESEYDDGRRRKNASNKIRTPSAASATNHQLPTANGVSGIAAQSVQSTNHQLPTANGVSGIAPQSVQSPPNTEKASPAELIAALKLNSSEISYNNRSQIPKSHEKFIKNNPELIKVRSKSAQNPYIPNANDDLRVPMTQSQQPQSSSVNPTDAHRTFPFHKSAPSPPIQQRPSLVSNVGGGSSTTDMLTNGKQQPIIKPTKPVPSFSLSSSPEDGYDARPKSIATKKRRSHKFSGQEPAQAQVASTSNNHAVKFCPMCKASIRCVFDYGGRFCYNCGFDVVNFSNRGN